MLQPSIHHIIATPMVIYEKTQDGSRMPAIKSSATVATPQRCSLRRLRARKHRILTPDSWSTYQSSDSGEPRFLHIPKDSKGVSINSLTWAILFSLIKSNFLMFWLCVCCKNSYISWLPPLTFPAISQSYLRCCILGLSPQFWPSNKT